MSLYYKSSSIQLRRINISTETCFIPINSILLFHSYEGGFGGKNAHIFQENNEIITNDTTISAMKIILVKLGYTYMEYVITDAKSLGETLIDTLLCNESAVSSKLRLNNAITGTRLGQLPADIRTGLLSMYLASGKFLHCLWSFYNDAFDIYEVNKLGEDGYLIASYDKYKQYISSVTFGGGHVFFLVELEYNGGLKIPQLVSFDLRNYFIEYSVDNTHSQINTELAELDRGWFMVKYINGNTIYDDGCIVMYKKHGEGTDAYIYSIQYKGWGKLELKQPIVDILGIGGELWILTRYRSDVLRIKWGANRPNIISSWNANVPKDIRDPVFSGIVSVHSAIGNRYILFSVTYILNNESSTVLYSFNMNKWIRQDLKKVISNRIHFDNDGQMTGKKQFYLVGTDISKHDVNNEKIYIIDPATLELMSTDLQVYPENTYYLSL